MRMHAKYHPAQFTTDLTEVNPLPEFCDDALISQVLSKLYAKDGKINRALFYKAEYKDYVKEAIIFRNTAKDGTHHTIRQYADNSDEPYTES
jgi:hypothetical protein